VKQDLITYSMAHDRLYESKGGKVIVGGYSFVIPQGSAVGDTFKIELSRASGTADGISQEVYLAAPTNQAIKTVRVGSAHYLVGDVAPFRWFNAGDFGDTNLLNNDVVQVFQSAVYRVNMPPEGSDFFDAMDSCCWNSSRVPVPSQALMNGAETNINSIVFGDGELDVRDVFVTFRRSLDPTLKWYGRYWSGGQRQYMEVPNAAPPTSRAPVSPLAKTDTALTRPLWAAVSADDVVFGGERTVQVPIRLRVGGGINASVVMLNLTVEPVDGAPTLTQAVAFAAAPGLGQPALNASRTAGNYAAAWLDSTAAGVGGTNVLGILTVQLPESLPARAAYRVHFEHVSISPNGLALIPCQTHDGILSSVPRDTCTWADGIPDLWRLRFFGGLSNALSRAMADPDGDCVCNYAEYLAGTSPLDAASVLRLVTQSPGQEPGAAARLRWQNNLNRRHVLEYRDSLTSGAWRPLYTNQNLDGAVSDFVDPASAGSSRFYRLRVAE
jgi:hypothetical protein